MGDLGYVNAIYTGVVRGTNEGNMKLSINELPSDSIQAVTKLRSLLSQLKNENTSGKKLLVIANDNFESLLHKCEDDIKQAEGVDILLTETNDTTLPVYTFRMPQYGIYYQAGRVICEDVLRSGQIVIANANPTDIPIRYMREGFTQAVMDYVAETPKSNIYLKSVFLSETTGGYHIPDSTYRLSYKISDCDYVLPLCGESAQGFLRYSREHSLAFSVIGVDYDMSNYGYAIPLSVVKHIDKATEQWILKWAKGEQIERHQSFGLDSGY